ncbi:hypothetical protein LSAT2_025759 [Lamellibrachia satsuma]|nr:hypothetical protein LSAT2_025759 [Lamellibrachia satsuma]
MAPALSIDPIEQITEDLSRTQGMVNFDDCLTKAKATTLSTFLLGSAAGVAVQVHFSRFIPRTMRACLIVPLVMGTSVALPVHNRLREGCADQWKSGATVVYFRR